MKHYLSVVTSMKTIFPKDVLDWFLWHKYLGFEHFYIIDDGCEPPVAEILEPYKDDITYFNIENKNKLSKRAGFHHREIVREMYNACNESTRWLAFMDEDEYLMPLSRKSIKEFLRTIEDKNALRLQWRTFGPEGKKMAHSGTEIILDQYRTYNYCCQGKMILNCEEVGELHMPGNCDQHRIVKDKVVDCYGEDIDAEYLDKFWQLPCGHDNVGSTLSPDMPFVINHYAYRSFEHINYRLFSRGDIDNRRVENISKRVLLDLIRFTNPKGQYLDNNYMRTFLFKDHGELRNGYKKFYKREMENHAGFPPSKTRLPGWAKTHSQRSNNHDEFSKQRFGEFPP